MTAGSPIRSQAQHDMLLRAAANPDYAKARGIKPEVAQAMLDDHKRAGAPKLPERAPASTTPIAATARPPRKFNLIGSR